MPCPHYKGGSTTCAICIRNQVFDLEDQKKRIQRQIRELLIMLGEEPEE